MAISRSEAFLCLSADLLHQGFGVRFSPKGGSMHPTIKDGETVTVVPIEPRNVKRGDIILYKTCEIGRPVIAHRVVRLTKNKANITSLVLRGDASQSDDSPITPEQILGKVVSVERRGRDTDLASTQARLLRAVHVCASRIKARAYSALEPMSKKYFVEER